MTQTELQTVTETEVIAGPAHKPCSVSTASLVIQPSDRINAFTYTAVRHRPWQQAPLHPLSLLHLACIAACMRWSLHACKAGPCMLAMCRVTQRTSREQHTRVQWQYTIHSRQDTVHSFITYAFFGRVWPRPPVRTFLHYGDKKSLWGLEPPRCVCNKWTTPHWSTTISSISNRWNMHWSQN